MFDDFDLKKFEQAEYRVKVLRIPWREVLEYVYGQTGLPEYVTFPRRGLPDGTKIVAVNGSNDPFTVEAYIAHPSFPEVPAGALPPRWGEDDDGLYFGRYALATQAEIEARWHTDPAPVFAPVKTTKG